MSTQNEERVKITPEQLDAMMPPGETVHTLMSAGPVLIGADWSRGGILEAAKNGAELSGAVATGMKHGAVVWNEFGHAVFIETTPAPITATGNEE